MIADRDELDKYLQANPWPLKFSQDKQVEYLFRFTSPLPREKVWRLLSDTSNINRRLGLQRVYFTEDGGKITGKGRLGFRLHEWEEVPWQWESPSYIKLSRIFTKGHASFVRIHYSIEPAGNVGTAVTMYFGWIPKNLAGRILLILARKRCEKKFRNIIDTLEEPGSENIYYYLNPQIAEPAPQAGRKGKTVINTGKLTSLKNEIVSSGTPLPVAEALVNLIRKAPDEILYRIRPLETAASMNLDKKTLIAAMINATKAGMLAMSWDIICPHCRGVRESHQRLSTVTRNASCPVCNIDFDATSLNMIEISFTVTPGIRRIEKIEYCSSEAAGKPHILLQKHLHTGNTYLYNLPQIEKRIKFRIHGKKYYGLLDLKSEAPVLNLYWDDISSNRIIEAGPGSTVFISNTENFDMDYVVEYNDMDAMALRPADLFNSQQFRDLFPAEYIEPGISIDAGIQNIMIIDVPGSTAYYIESGDSRAFMTINRFSGLIHAIAMEFNGAMIKTMGDGVMLSFDRPMEAVKAGIRILKRLDGTGEIPLKVRISLHRGECLAVNLDSSIDYFGRAVNIAALLKNSIGAGEMLLSEPFASEPTVNAYLTEKGYQKNYTAAEIPGAGETRYLKIKVRRN